MKKLFFAFAAFAALVSCSENKIQNPSEAREVSIVANATETKTLLNEDAVVWEANDAVALLFSRDAAYSVNTLTTTESGAIAKFTGKLPNDVSVAGGYAETGYAVYPSSAVENDGTISFNLPSAVTANENGSFDSGKNLSSTEVSLAELDANGTTTANFKNALSVVRFTLSSGITSVKLTAAGGNLAGAAAMGFDENGRLEVASWTEPATEMTITPEGESFASSDPFNVLVYPGAYSSITAELTDTDGCRYTKTVEGPFNFEASKFYTFTFKTKFEKTYTFKATGRTFTAGEQIQTVFGALHSEVLTAAADASFTGNLPAEVVHADTEGYAIYPASAYSAGHISYDLDPVSPAELWSAALRPTSTTVAFSSVADVLAKVQFTVPAGVKSVKIVSDKGLVGTAEMTVAAGKLVAGAGAGTEIDIDTTAGGNYTLNVYPVAGAALTVTLTDAAGATVQKNLELTVAAGSTQTLDISGDISFDKNGNFTNESYTEGGSFEF